MKKSELIGVILSIIGLILLTIDLEISMDWTVWSFIGLALVIPGVVLISKSTFKQS